MRLSKIAICLLFAAALFATGNTCTLTNAAGSACASKTCTMSAIAADVSHANWTGAGCTANGYVPSSDYIIVPDTYTLTVDQNTTLGNSGAPLHSYVRSITAGTGGSGQPTFSGGTIATNNAAATGYNSGTGAVTMIRFGMYTGASAAATCAVTGTTCVVNWVQGGGTAAVDAKATGVLKVAASTTLTLRGSATYTAGVGNTTDYLVMLPGSNIVLDSSLAATGVFYSIAEATASDGLRAVNATCTPTQRCAVSSTGNPSQFGNCSASGCVHYGNVTMDYVDLTNIGEVGKWWLWSNYSTTTGVYSVQHSTFTNCGKVFLPNANSGLQFTHNYNVHTGTLSSDGTTFFVLNNSLSGSGKRIATGNVFDLMVGGGGDGLGGIALQAFTFTDNYIGGSIDIFSSSVGFTLSARNLYLFGNGISPTSDWIADPTSTNDYYLIDTDNTGNFHWIVFQPTNATYTGTLFERPTGPSGGNVYPGVGIVGSTGNPGTLKTVAVSNALSIANMLGQASLTTIASTQSSTVNLDYSHNHNTFTGGGPAGAQLATFHINENANNAAGTMTSYKSNLSYGASYSNMFNWQTVSGINTDVAAPANLTNNASDSGLAPTQGGCGICTNQGNGYYGAWSSTPGADATNKFNVVPMFADPLRGVALWPTRYFGLTATAGATCPPGGNCRNAWVTSTSYAVGDVVSDSNASVYGSSTLLYRCTVAHTSGAGTEPGIGGTWRSDWEWEGLHLLRYYMGNYTTFTDSSLVGCSGSSPCLPIAALSGWVKRGYTPQNAIMYKAGHDGATIGAVDSPTVAIAPVVF